jgi:hypothetical protein
MNYADDYHCENDDKMKTANKCTAAVGILVVTVKPTLPRNQLIGLF